MIDEITPVAEKRCIVFDLDGTLIDSSERFRRCELESRGNRYRFWECFQSPKYMDFDRPRYGIVKLLLDYRARGYRIIIVTGRCRETQELKTLEQLREWGIEFDEIYFRSRNDYRKDYVFKSEIIREIGSRCIIEAIYDDSIDVVNTLNRMGYRVIHIDRIE